MEISVEPQALRQKLAAMVGERSPYSGWRHLVAVEKYIEKEFASYGLIVESDFFFYRGKRFRNIIARLAPQPATPSFLIGAHFDTVEGTPGADDNASGVAVLLEAARLLSRAKPRLPVVFCAFNLEELNMVGSTHLAQKLKGSRAKIEGMISLEMVGYTDPRPGSQKYPVGLKWFYPDRGDFIGIIGNWKSAPLLRRFSRLMRQVPGLPVETLSVPGNGGLIPEVRLSDHSPFWDAGYPALLVTDTSFFRNPHYHRPTDTLETLDLNFMARVCTGVVTAVSRF